MDYQRIVKGILDIGEAMLQSGAENFRLEDSIYRMCKAYGFRQYDVFAIPSNIQITVETRDGEFITQIRHIETMDTNYDRLDYLNDLSRRVCSETPDADKLQELFTEVMNRKAQHPAVKYLAHIVSGASFAIFFGCGITDAAVAALISLILVMAGNALSKRENNLLIYNTILAFLAEFIILIGLKTGLVIHPECIMIGIVMLLISALATTNGIRELLQRDYISGAINIMNSILGASGIAIGIALAMLLMYNIRLTDGAPAANSQIVRLVSCTVGCIGFALLFKVKGRQVIYSGIGAFFTYTIYLLVYSMKPSNFFATLMGSIFVAFYAFIMSRINKAPSTIFLTASVFPLVPGAALYYTMYGFVSLNYGLAREQLFVLLTTCFGIAFGFLIVDVITRSVMAALKRDYHIGKHTILH